MGFILLMMLGRQESFLNTQRNLLTNLGKPLEETGYVELKEIQLALEPATGAIIGGCIIGAAVGHGAQIIAANKRQEKALAHKCNTADSVPVPDDIPITRQDFSFGVPNDVSPTQSFRSDPSGFGSFYNNFLSGAGGVNKVCFDPGHPLKFKRILCLSHQ